MWLFGLVVAVVIYQADASDFCAWDRGVELNQENVLRSYMFIIGEYNRDFTVSSGGQTQTWQGMPYYKMTSEGCTLDELFLYRHLDYQVNPPTPHWVISSSVGTTPISSYAYCGPLSGVNVADLNSPALDACNGNWYIGDPAILEQSQTAAHTRDPYFRVQFGGCPQLTCNELNFCSTGTDVWADGTSSGGVNCLTYSSYSSLGRPNIYRATHSDSVSGFYYLFFNPKTYVWAIDPELTTEKYDVCENYKKSKGFAVVFNAVIEARSPIESSWPVDGDYVSLDLADDSATRRITCVGTMSTSSPTAAHAPVPTPSPTDDLDNICRTFVAGGASQAAPTWQAICGLYVPTVANSGFTSYPTVASTPTVAGSAGTPTVANSGTPGTPTVAGSVPSPGSPTSAPTGSAAATTRANVYLLCVAVALYLVLN
mmetsp:Transcript_778/g.1485  ORF Transcript_778/g.1485 Transcript_778/m.1485 type:complete len:427 (-) Transcript_778:144-1424(-)